MSIKFITNDQLYKQAIEPIAGAISFVWIGTADIKDLHVHHKGTIQSFLTVLDSLLKKKVAVRLLHAGKMSGKCSKREIMGYKNHHDEFFNAFKCREKCRELAKQRLNVDERICGLCICVCPHGKKNKIQVTPSNCFNKRA
jgi:hypothetical protein